MQATHVIVLVQNRPCPIKKSEIFPENDPISCLFELRKDYLPYFPVWV